MSSQLAAASYIYTHYSLKRKEQQWWRVTLHVKTCSGCNRYHPFYVAASVVWWLACWPLVPKFAGSNPAEAVGFLG
jgi:hypothetical protein